MYWQQLTRPKLDAFDRKTPVILPISAIEQHGPHLPLATDRIINEHFCRELERSISKQVLILPTMSVCCSQHHMGFTGTLTLTHNTFLDAATQILDCVAQHGFKNIIIFNSHGGNLGIGQVLLERFGGSHPNCQVVFATWWKIAGEQLFQLSKTGPGGVGHACEFETSLMLLAAADLVDQDAITKDNYQSTYSWAEADLLRAGKASIYRTFKEISANGTYGDPTAACREKGEAITKAVMSAFQQIVLDMQSD